MNLRAILLHPVVPIIHYYVINSRGTWKFHKLQERNIQKKLSQVTNRSQHTSPLAIKNEIWLIMQTALKKKRKIGGQDIHTPIRILIVMLHLVIDYQL